MASNNHAAVAVQPSYPIAGQYPGTYVATSVVIGQPPPQQHHASPSNKYNPSYSRVSSILFGILQIALCIISITGAGLVQIYEGSGYDLGTGFWCGIIYAAAGCLAAVAGWYAPRRMLVAVAVFSFLDIAFGLTAVVLATIGLIEDGDCDIDYCVTENVSAMAGNAMVCATGFWQSIFGLCLLVISVRAICIGSKPQVTSVPVYYSTSAPETVQINTTTSMQSHDVYPSTINGALQNPQRAAEENGYQIGDQQKF